MKPLVLALEADCLDQNVSILEVLRKALVVARKLSLTDARSWIEKELNGYKEGDAAPPHRLLMGQIEAWNPYQGWIPVMFDDPKMATQLAKCYVGQPIGELEILAKRNDDKFEFPFDPETLNELLEGSRMRLRTTRRLSGAAVGGIIDAVRNMVLDWCLQLERDGILGEGLVFNDREKTTAANSTHTINYNAPVAHSQIQQSSPHATQTMSVSLLDESAVIDFVRLLREHVIELKLDVPTRDRLDVEIERVETEASLRNPRKTALNESLQTIRNILEGCAGSLIASGLLFEIGKILK